MFPKVVLYQPYMPARSLDVPEGLSDDEILRRVIDTTARRDLGACIVWSSTRMTRVLPIGVTIDETPTRRILEATPLGSSLPPVYMPGEPGYEPPPLRVTMRKKLAGRWAVSYPEPFGMATPPEDSTLELRPDGTYTWTSPLPWFASGQMWSLNAHNGRVELFLQSRYHWFEFHELAYTTSPNGVDAWIWRADDGRAVFYAIRLH